MLACCGSSEGMCGPPTALLVFPRLLVASMVGTWVGRGWRTLPERRMMKPVLVSQYEEVPGCWVVKQQESILVCSRTAYCWADVRVCCRVAGALLSVLECSCDHLGDSIDCLARLLTMSDSPFCGSVCHGLGRRRLRY